jgi:hypothetical protein
MPAFDVYYNDELGAVQIDYTSDFRVSEHLTDLNDRTVALLDSLDHEVYLLGDSTELVASFTDVVQGLGQLKQGLNFLNHPNVFEVVTVSESSILRMATNALGQAQYGQLRSNAFASLGEGKDYIRANPIT